MAEVHRILKEMYIGMAVCMIVFLAIGAFFMRPYYIFALALLVGNLGGALRIYHIRLVYASAADRGLRNDALYRTCIICHDTVRIHSLPEMGCIQESVRSDIPVLPDQRDQ